MTAWRESKRGRRAFYGGADGAAAYRMHSHDLDDAEHSAMGRNESTRPPSAWHVAAVRRVRSWLADAFGLAPLVVDYDGATLLRVELQDGDEVRRWSLWVVDRADADIPVTIDDRVSVVAPSMGSDVVAWLNAHGIGCILVDDGRVTQVGDRRLHLKVYDPHREVSEIASALGRDGGFKMLHLVAVYFRRRELRSARRHAEWSRWNRSHLRKYYRKWVAENAESLRERRRAWSAENAERIREKDLAYRSRPDVKARKRALAKAKRAEARRVAGMKPIDRTASRAELRKARLARAAESFKARYANDPEFRKRIKANQQRSAERKAANAGVG